MITEIGHFALVLALGLALVQGTLPLIGAARRDASLLALAPSAAVGQFVLVSTALAALAHAYVSSDFSVLNVAENSHSTKPLIYRISGTWGNHEGSLLLWVWILALFGAAVAMFARDLPSTFKARALAVQGLIGTAFLAFMLLTSNPFARILPAPLDGRGLNPILQDPGLALHPPMLYLGYVGFSMAYSFAMAALLEGRIDSAWARALRPWVLIAWIGMTLGIALGSWWAYYELGWGGFWFWDPVENASFMPWLAGTALLHSAMVVEKRDALKAWTILLAILTFALSLLGTFLVRSGVLTSVHTFASDPARGAFILAIFVVAVGGSLLLYAWRAPLLEPGGLFAPLSREGGIVLNNLLLATATATVLLGTLYPLALEILGGSKISVGAPYFNATFVPLMVPLFVALPVGAMLAWKRADLGGVAGRLGFAALVSGGAALLAGWILGVRFPLALLGFALAAWLIVGSGAEIMTRIGLGRLPLRRVVERARGLPRATMAMAMAHAGMGVLVAGVTAVSALQEEVITSLAPGETTTLAGYEVRLDEVSAFEGPNFVAQRGRFTISTGGETVTTLASDKRFYPVERQPTTEAGIDSGLWRDLYVVLGDQVAGDRWTVRLFLNPLAFWIWGGAGLMALGGLISLSDRRFRVGAPERAAKRAEPALAGS